MFTLIVLSCLIVNCMRVLRQSQIYPTKWKKKETTDALKEFFSAKKGEKESDEYCNRTHKEHQRRREWERNMVSWQRGFVSLLLRCYCCRCFFQLIEWVNCDSIGNLEWERNGIGHYDCKNAHASTHNTWRSKQSQNKCKKTRQWNRLSTIYFGIFACTYCNFS